MLILGVIVVMHLLGCKLKHALSARKQTPLSVPEFQSNFCQNTTLGEWRTGILESDHQDC